MKLSKKNPDSKVVSQTNTESSSKPPLRDFAFAEPVPPDHWIYKRGAQFGFVSALPKSIADSQAKATEARQANPADSSVTSAQA
jgi:hypothetical protein